jgi:hypothetical protein
MDTDRRPTVVGSPDKKTASIDFHDAIARLEADLKRQAESLRMTRHDFIRGVISERDLEAVEARFVEKLVEQRQILQNLRSAAAGGRQKK